MSRQRQSLGRSALQLVNQTVRPLDRLAAREVQRTTSPVFVVGLPRSGTTLAYELLVQALDVAFLTRIYSYTYGMPNLVTRMIRSRIGDPRAHYTSDYGRIRGRYAPAENAVFWDQWMPVTSNLGHYVPVQSISSEAATDASTTVASISAIAGRPYVFKNVYMTLSLPALFRLLPDAKVIVVRRQVEANIASIYKRRKSLPSWWSIRPPFAQDVEDSSVLEQTAFQCVRSQQILDDALRDLPAGSLMLIDYEAICEAPLAFIDRVASWVGPDFARRPGYQVPASFAPSKGPGLPDSEAASLPGIIEALGDSGSEYISQLHASVAGTE